MLLNGFNHVALLTADTEQFVAFFRDVFEAEVIGLGADAMADIRWRNAAAIFPPGSFSRCGAMTPAPEFHASVTR